MPISGALYAASRKRLSQSALVENEIIVEQHNVIVRSRAGYAGIHAAHETEVLGKTHGSVRDRRSRPVRSGVSSSEPLSTTITWALSSSLSSSESRQRRVSVPLIPCQDDQRRAAHRSVRRRGRGIPQHGQRVVDIFRRKTRDRGQQQGDCPGLLHALATWVRSRNLATCAASRSASTPFGPKQVCTTSAMPATTCIGTTSS